MKFTPVLISLLHVACATNLRGLTSSYTISFTKVGDGFCRTADHKTGKYDLLCTKDRYPCDFDTCQYFCEVIDDCLAFEYKDYKCEIHYKEMPYYKQDHEAKCYKKEKKNCGFRKIGTGYCRDAHDTKGTSYDACNDDLGHCSRDACKDYCRHDSHCVGIEYQEHSGKCEIHTEEVTHVSDKSGVACYEYIGPCH